MSGGVQGPPRLRGAGGFADVWEARFCYTKMAARMARLLQSDELSQVRWEMFQAPWTIFEQEHPRFFNVFVSIGGGVAGVTTLRCVNENKSLFREWHHRFVTTPGQYDQVHEEIVQHLVKETSAKNSTRLWRS